MHNHAPLLPEPQNEPPRIPIKHIFWGLWLIRGCFLIAQLSGLYDATMTEWFLTISSIALEAIDYTLKKWYGDQNQ